MLKADLIPLLYQVNIIMLNYLLVQ